MKCTNCGHARLRGCYLTSDTGVLYLVDGEPSLKNQLMGKKKPVKAMRCEKCGHCELFSG